MLAPEQFNATYYAVVAAIACPLFGLVFAWLVKTLRSPAPDDESANYESVFAGLNKTGLRVFIVLFLVCWPLCWIPWCASSCNAKRRGMTADPSGRWLWPSLRTRRAMLVAAVLLGAYVGSYAWLSRRGMKQAKDWGMEGFFYVSTEEVMATHDLRKQLCLVVFYAPANMVDHALFGTPGPVRSMMFELAGGEPNDPPQ